MHTLLPARVTRPLSDNPDLAGLLVRRLMRRARLSPEHARVVIELAHLGPREARNG
jgi:hypothetical protein